MSSRDSEPTLRGRAPECEVLDHLLADASAGLSRVLVLRGEPGVGKTALLDYLSRRATACRVVRTAGVESEMELPYAGLHQLCAPFLHRIDHLPAAQAQALGTAFGMRVGEPQDRFLAGLAVLNLLAEAAEDKPLLCMVDDAQWLDVGSVQSLAFVARRLAAERIAVVFAVRGARSEPDPTGLSGFAELALQGLEDDDARALLQSAVAGPFDDQVCARIIAETRGNPLALQELPRALSPAELAGGFGLPHTVPIATRIEEGFVRQLAPLAADARTLLLTAAAEPVGDVTLLWRALKLLGIAPTRAAEASAEWIEIGARVRFRHPLVRSAAYRAASARELREVHHALAEATDPDLDPDRRAWHRAHAAVGPDESVATDLERSAGRARARGGVAAAAAFLERAAELTPDPARRGARALAAAQAKFDAADPAAAVALTTTAEMCPLDALGRALLQRLRAQLTFARRRGSEAPALFLDAARLLEPLDVELARETHLEALGAAIVAGRLGAGLSMRQLAEAARAAPAGPQPPTPADVLLDALAVRFTDDFAAAVPALRRALDAFVHGQADGTPDVRWLWLAWPVAYDLWDDEAWHQLTEQLVRFVRETGAFTVFPIALIYRAQVHIQAGEFGAASALLEEVERVKQAIGSAPLMQNATTASGPLVLAAWRGNETRASQLITATIPDALANGEGRAIAAAEYASAVLYNGLARYDAALAAAQRACEHDDLALYAWALTELVEAGTRSGHLDEAASAMRQLEQRTQAAGTDWALGIEARCRALLTSGDSAERLYQQAIERLARTRIRVASARAHLLYGEWLRREGRRVDARQQLRVAHDMFTAIGMEAFAGRARAELAATGETARKRNVETRDDLTAQEGQIARLARDGRTNPEIGAQLFLSTRTVEWHLHKVFTKLGISSRRQLRSAIPATELATAPA